MDLWCVGLAVQDIGFSLEEFPLPDSKNNARALSIAGGGPAANAAVLASKFGVSTAFIGHLGQDTFGEIQYKELSSYGIHMDYVIRNENPTPTSTILSTTKGDRTIITYGISENYLKESELNLPSLLPKAILFDGHQPEISTAILKIAKKHNVPTILDAGSIHTGTDALYREVDYLIASEKFYRQWNNQLGKDSFDYLKRHVRHLIITLGDKGLIYVGENNEKKKKKAFPIDTIDTCGAGDTFHGAFAAGQVQGLSMENNLRQSSAAGAFCCTKLGAREGIPSLEELQRFLEKYEEYSL